MSLATALELVGGALLIIAGLLVALPLGIALAGVALLAVAYAIERANQEPS